MEVDMDKAKQSRGRRRELEVTGAVTPSPEIETWERDLIAAALCPPGDRDRLTQLEETRDAE